MMATGAWTKLATHRWKFGLTPDWEYFEQASMVDPFYQKRVEEFLAPPPSGVYYDVAWSDADKNKVILIALKRYPKEAHWASEVELEQLQILGLSCYNHVRTWLDTQTNFNQKDDFLAYEETARRLQVEWIN
jgi:hypothetical protein